MIEADATKQPDEAWVREVCKIGHGHACCRYLTIAAGKGWSCEKATTTGRYLDTRVETETITARGDNCTGRASASPDAQFEGTLEDRLR